MTKEIFPIFLGDGEHPVAEEYTLANGMTISILSLGERGRGRKRLVIPINCPPETVIEAVSIGETKSGRIRFYIEKKPKNASACILMGNFYGGYRGSLEYHADPGIEILDVAWSAEGAAGRAGHHRQPLLKMPKNARLKIEKCGRTYGRPHDWIAWFDGEKLIILPVEEYELIAEYRTLEDMKELELSSWI